MDTKLPSNRRYCRNCHHPLPDEARFCPECSQKYTTGRVTLRQMLQEFVEAVFNIDSKIFQSILALFIPGKLTEEYFSGRHKRYVHPLRLFFVMAIITIAVISFVSKDSIRNEASQQGKELIKKGYQSEFHDELDSVKVSVLEKFPDEEVVKQAMDSLDRGMRRYIRMNDDSLYVPYFELSMMTIVKQHEIYFRSKDIVELPVDTLLTRYGIEGLMRRTTAKQYLRFVMERREFFQFMLGSVVWMVLLMMLALALILKLLYIRRGQYYVEHLVFSFHYHAFSFLIFILAILYGAFISKENEAGPIIIAGLVTAIYLYIAMYRVYGQSHGKTFVKYSILNFFYLFIFALFLGLDFVISVLAF